VQAALASAFPPEQARALMEYVARFKEGRLARYFALALFAGIRPGGELEKLAAYPNLIDLHNQVVRISPAIAKTGKPRQITIHDNLYQWLTQFGGDLLPVNHDRDLKHIRQKFGLSRDVLRHTFISMHIGAFKSFADTSDPHVNPI
jgi:integrase